MNKRVYWLLELNIKNGKTADLKTLAAEMVQSTREEEEGTLSYEWHTNKEATQCHIYESYKDSDAALIHLGNFQEKFADRFFSILEVRKFTVYGAPNKQLYEALSGIGAECLETLNGFNR